MRNFAVLPPFGLWTYAHSVIAAVNAIVLPDLGSGSVVLAEKETGLVDCTSALLELTKTLVSNKTPNSGHLSTCLV